MNIKTGLIADPRFQNHLNPEGHPESHLRIDALMRRLDSYNRHGLIKIDPSIANIFSLEAIHESNYLTSLASTAGMAPMNLDPDTSTSEQSYATALLAAGSCIKLADGIVAKDFRNGFALIRPPGHHAEKEGAKGFCLLNNIAITAQHLIDYHDYKKIAIIDWDVHHGNGSQHSFEDSKEVLFMSMHQYPFYPGTGSLMETGKGDGKGYTVNLPMDSYTSIELYLDKFNNILLPILKNFEPDFILISAGFDAHKDDPLGQQFLDESVFANMTEALNQVAHEYCEGRMLAILEGGYNLDALSSSVVSVLDKLGEEAKNFNLNSACGHQSEIYKLRKHFEVYWNF